MTALRQISLPTKTLADQLRAACILECTAPKPGNVFPGASFVDVSYTDFLASAEAIAPVLARSKETGAGVAIREGVLATLTAVGTNTNLGMLLLLAPLAAIPTGTSCADGIATVLQQLDMHQTGCIYDAIRLAQPGGLGEVAANDVSRPPEIPIVEAMALTPHDRIAWQYTHDFADVLVLGRERFLLAIHQGLDWSTALVRVHVEFIARQSDSLILRKCGMKTAAEAQNFAQRVLADWPMHAFIPGNLLQQFDSWLRSDGHRRNPGTTADLLAAMLFAMMRDGVWSPPESLTVE